MTDWTKEEDEAFNEVEKNSNLGKQILKDMGQPYHWEPDAIKAAVLIEREACARVCENSVEYAGDELAKQIRARGYANDTSAERVDITEEHKHDTPPQRTWVGLTDEEIEQGCKESWVTEQAFQSAVWWAEAKLKEKNT
jgi:hypothetical protein